MFRNEQPVLLQWLMDNVMQRFSRITPGEGDASGPQCSDAELLSVNNSPPDGADALPLQRSARERSAANRAVNSVAKRTDGMPRGECPDFLRRLLVKRM